MPGGKTKNQTTTQTQSAQPWVQDDLQYATDKARALYDKGLPGYFPGQTWVNFDPATTAALDGTMARASGGNAGVAGSQQLIADTVNGKFMGSNPNLQGAIDSATEGIRRNFSSAVMPGISSNFASAGRFGSGLYQSAQENAQQVLADQIGQTAGDIAYQDYAGERARQLQAAGMATGLANQDYVDLSKMAAVGETREAKAGQQLADEMARYQYQTGAEGTALDQFLARLGVIDPMAGGVSTATVPVAQSNPWAQIAGLGLTAAGYAFGGPMGGMAAGGLSSALTQGTGSGGSASPYMSFRA